ncbi:hypothetical protein [Nodularia sp. UHCC 0506]|uniref:hypothetical protein n=1 Tax=Nodularia sp. UHCC 0506 TaxID=3110243 RepID=UPI002B21BD04|nr:hypothetical protein [Nodularia sp. UHCC 0506]MEA5514591.1 hypothetical protein [Nodularia sp. UHCC 0506]
MNVFFDILKISSVIAALNNHWDIKAVFIGIYRQKPGFLVIQDWLNLRLVMYLYATKFRQTQPQPLELFAPTDKKHYKTNLKSTVISLLKLVNTNLEILLIKKTFIENDVIKWLPAFH